MNAKWKPCSRLTPRKGAKLIIFSLSEGKPQDPISTSISIPLWRFHVKGLTVKPLQGLHSASPRYIPAYILVSPNGAFPGHE